MPDSLVMVGRSIDELVDSGLLPEQDGSRVPLPPMAPLPAPAAPAAAPAPVPGVVTSPVR